MTSAARLSARHAEDAVAARDPVDRLVVIYCRLMLYCRVTRFVAKHVV